jgi:hypothetical protein
MGAISSFIKVRTGAAAAGTMGTTAITVIRTMTGGITREELGPAEEL